MGGWTSLIGRENLIDYATSRLNSDGGYSFSYPLFGTEFPSSISETYYALSIFSILGEEIPERGRTEEYLRGIQRKDGRYDSTAVAFYAVKSLLLIGRKPERLGFVDDLQGVLRKPRIFSGQFGGGFFSADYDLSESPFVRMYHASETISALGLPVGEDAARIFKPNADGGFGARNSDVVSTYHALAALACGGHDAGRLSRTAEFVEKCEARGGGYSGVPGGMPPFMETTHSAIMAMKLLGREAACPERHANFIARFQNGDGGFRRSPYLGISMLCSSYLAVKCLSMLGGDFAHG